MSLTTFSLRNPLVVAVVAAVLCCFGAYAYFSLGVSEVPTINLPIVSVTTVDAGADPATVETQITKPIEDAVSALPNVSAVTSTSGEGQSEVDVQFTAAANGQFAPIDVERVVNGVRGSLPPDADAPAIQAASTGSLPSLIAALYGPQSTNELQGIGDERVRPALEAVPGVQSVQVLGGAVREIQVKVDLAKLRAYGLGLNEVQQALQAEQVQTPAGQLAMGERDLNVRVQALVTSPDQLGQIAVATTPSGTVYVRDVATIEDGFQTTQTLNRVNGAPAVTVSITKQPGANVIQVNRDVRDAIVRVQSSLPAGAKLDVFFDTAIYAQQSFGTIRKALVEAVFATGLILLLFLHTWRSTLIVLVAIPTSLLTAVGAMLLMGFDLNLLTMLALTLSVGILVDDSIVVLENVYRHLKLREPPYLAALHGRSEIGFAALTITFVDVVVYVPMALIPGLIGQVLGPFALVIASATLTSLLISFTLTPMLASRFLTRDHALHQGRGRLAAFGRWWDGGFARVASAYRTLLRVSLAGTMLRIGRVRVGARWAVVACGLATVAGSVLMLQSGRIGLDVFPRGDQGEVQVSLSMPPATTLARMDEVSRDLEARLRAYPEVRTWYTSVNARRVSVTVLLAPVGERRRSSDEVAQAMLRDLDPHLPGSRLDTGAADALGFFTGSGGGEGQQSIAVTVRGQDPVVLGRLVQDVEGAMKGVPGAVGVTSSEDASEPEAVFTVDRAKATALGVTAQTAASSLRTAISGAVVGKYRRPGQKDVDVRLMAGDAFRSPDLLATLPLLAGTGAIVQLGQVGSVHVGAAPVRISHDHRQRSVVVSASPSGRSAGSVEGDVQAAVAKLVVPPGYTVDAGGQGAGDLAAFADVLKALGAGLALMYLLMVLLFRSFTLPLAVLASLPLALVGALGAMTLTGTPFTLFSIIGFFLLLGLVGKNAILLVDYTDTLRKRGLGRTDALVEAGPTRLRPILMTTLSVIVALSPVAFGAEPGSEVLRAAAIVLLGGLFTSMLLTLLLVPAMYTIFDDVQRFFLGLARRVATPRPLEAAELELLRPSEESWQRSPVDSVSE